MDEIRISLQEILTKTKWDEDNFDQDSFEHEDLTKRIRKTLYYDPCKNPDKDTLSFAITRSAVSSFRNAAPTPIKKLGHRYASRVARDACISPCALLLGLIYIERLKHKNPNYLKEVSSSDLFLISMMVASKYLFDEGSEDEVFNDEWAVSGDMPVEKVNKLEADFLRAIDWQLYVRPHEFLTMLNVAETDIAIANGLKRGWLTYSDLRVMLDCHTMYGKFSQTVGIVYKAACMCMVMYSGLICLAALSSIALLSVTSTSQTTKVPSPRNLSGMESDTAEMVEYREEDLDVIEPAPEFIPSFIVPPSPLHGSGVRGRNRKPCHPSTARTNDMDPMDFTSSKHSFDDPPVPDKTLSCFLLEAVMFIASVPSAYVPPGPKIEQNTNYTCTNSTDKEEIIAPRCQTCTKNRENTQENFAEPPRERYLKYETEKTESSLFASVPWTTTSPLLLHNFKIPNLVH